MENLPSYENKLVEKIAKKNNIQVLKTIILAFILLFRKLNKKNGDDFD